MREAVLHSYLDTPRYRGRPEAFDGLMPPPRTEPLCLGELRPLYAVAPGGRGERVRIGHFCDSCGATGVDRGRLKRWFPEPTFEHHGARATL